MQGCSEPIAYPVIKQITKPIGAIIGYNSSSGQLELQALCTSRVSMWSTKLMMKTVKMFHQ